MYDNSTVKTRHSFVHRHANPKKSKQMKKSTIYLICNALVWSVVFDEIKNDMRTRFRS